MRSRGAFPAGRAGAAFACGCAAGDGRTVVSRPERSDVVFACTESPNRVEAMR